jgi:hypothetical protein
MPPRRKPAEREEREILTFMGVDEVVASPADEDTADSGQSPQLPHPPHPHPDSGDMRVIAEAVDPVPSRQPRCDHVLRDAAPVQLPRERSGVGLHATDWVEAPISYVSPVGAGFEHRAQPQDSRLRHGLVGPRSPHVTGDTPSMR